MFLQRRRRPRRATSQYVLLCGRVVGCVQRFELSEDPATASVALGMYLAMGFRGC